MFDIYELSIAAWIAIGVSLLSAVYLLAFLLPRLLKIKRRAATDQLELESEQQYPDVSVVIYADTETDGLRRMIPQLFAQDYPAKMEVIVVNDEDSEAAADAVNELQLKYPELYMTFTPGKSRNLSRRKLALTIGIKAAHYDCMLLTHGNCSITSPLWLRSMARHFAESAQMVLGYATLLDHDGRDSGRMRRSRAFDRAFVAARWISSALAGKAVRGNGYNLGYTKSLFFQHKGFANSLGLFAGDDDVFVSELAADADYSVELSPESIVEIHDFNPAYQQRMDNMSRRFTSRFLRQGGFRLFGSFSCAWWLWLLAGGAGIVLALPTLIGAAAFAVVLLGLWLPMMFAWRNLCRVLNIRPQFLTVPFLALFHPFYTLRFRLRRRNSVRDYSWERLN